MKKLLAKLINVLERVKGYFPSPLPIGVTEHNQWADSIIRIYDLPNNDSFRFTIATMILEIKKDRDKVPKNYLKKCILKAAANQVASAIMYELREKHKREVAEATAKSLEATTSAASNEHQN